MPLLLANLGASNLIIGLLPALAAFGAFLPGMLSAAYLQRVPVKKRVLVTMGMIERLFLLSIAAGLMMFAQNNPNVAIAWILVAWMMSSLVSGLVLPAFHSMLAKCLRPEERGGMIGWSGALAGISGVFAAQAVGLVLVRMPFPENYSILFVAAFAVLAATILPFLFTREPADPEPEEYRSVRQYVHEAVVTLRSNSGYSWAVASLAVISFSLMAASFYSTCAVRNLGAGATEVARFSAITVGTSVAAFPVLGKIADRSGNKRVLRITAASFALAAALALAWPTLESIHCSLVLAGIGSTGLMVSQNVIWSEFAPSHSEVPMYTAMSLLLIMPFRVAAPVLAGWIADVWGFRVMFSAALVAGALAWAILYHAVPEPRRNGTRN